MLNTRELERRWLSYKIKSFIPHTIIIASITIIGVMINLFLQNSKVQIVEVNSSHITPKKELEPIVAFQNTTVPIQEKIQIVEVVLKKEDIPIEKTEKLILEPSLSFMQRMQNSTLPYYQEKEPKTQQKYTIKEKIQKKSASDKTILKNKESTDNNESIENKNQDEESTTNKIVIERHNTKNDIDNIINRFKKNNNPALSLFIAKKYFELGDYHNSYNYALITNQINRNIEASWIIFSKSLVKLGKKDMAVQTLKEYIKESYSNNAQLLLDDIQSGKFQ